MANDLKHLGIIPDGNRRYAKKLSKKPWKGHQEGSEKLEQVIRWLGDTDVQKVTVYSLSWENLNKRPRDEFNYLMKLFKNKSLEKAESEEVHENEICFKVVGKHDKLPKEVTGAFKKLEKATKDYDNLIINLAVAYSGRQEVLHAFKEIKENGLEINEENVEKNLWIDGDSPEMIIRTGGEKRLSNFLLWQSAYSELYFIDKMWPEIEKEDINKALEEYRDRERRFGK